MSEAGQRLLEGAREAVAVAKGEMPAAAIHVNGFTYVPKPEWLPMEKAPRAGEEVIVLVEARDVYPKVMCAAWYAASDEIGWWNARHHVLGDEDLSGWLPLPPPPTGEQE